MKQSPQLAYLLLRTIAGVEGSALFFSDLP